MPTDYKFILIHATFIDGHSRAVYGISWHPDGALIATAGLDAFGRIWDVRIGKAIQLLRGHVKQILAVDFAPNGFVYEALHLSGVIN